MSTYPVDIRLRDVPKLPAGKWIEFFLVRDTGKTFEFEIRAKSKEHFVLGRLKWYGPWRTYAFFPYGPWRTYAFFPDSDTTVFEIDCLGTIIQALSILTSHRAALRARKA